MSSHQTSISSASATTSASRLQRFGQWVQDPMNSAIAASLVTCSTLGFVLSTMWVIDKALS